MNDLAKRAVACKGWKWLPGTKFGLDVPGYGGTDRVLSNDGYTIKSIFREVDGKPAGWLPKFDDVATIGCLLALVRAAWGEQCEVVSVIHSDGDTSMVEVDDGAATRTFHAESYAEALVAALEKVP